MTDKPTQVGFAVIMLDHLDKGHGAIIHYGAWDVVAPIGPAESESITCKACNVVYIAPRETPTND